jgi:Xaa-Pro dipeptidase
MIAEIQAALQQANLDGWFFYSFRGSDPIAAQILGNRSGGHMATRRWLYLIPRSGEPIKINHAIEPDALEHLPGKRLIYLPWQQLHQFMRESLLALSPGRIPRVAMQYSPNGSIPYIGRVDAGTIELIRSFGVEIVSSAELVQRFESVWRNEQIAMHDEAARLLYSIVREAFAEIGKRLRAKAPTTEFGIQCFIASRFSEHGLISSDLPIVAVNANSASPHYAPTEERHSPITEGDFVLIDLWGKLNRSDAVYADITWVGVAAKQVPAEIVKVFTVVRDARDAAVKFATDAFRAGKSITGASVDDACRAVIRNAGYAEQSLHRTGHNIHTEVHGNGANIDNLESADTRVLLPKTCFSIEPGIYLPGKFGIRSEIDVLTLEKDARVTGGEPQREVLCILA